MALVTTLLSSVQNPIGSFTSITITGLTASRAVVTDANKTLASSATTATELGYVNGVTSSIQTQIDNKGNYQPCLVATVFGLNATFTDGEILTNAGTQAALSIDGIALSVGNRVLVKNQSTPLANGIYTVTNVGSGATNWVLTRASDMPTESQVVLGRMIFVARGTVNACSYWGVFGSSNLVSNDDIFFSNMQYYAARMSPTQGFRLTLTSNVAVTTSDVTGATTVYMTPYISNLISLYDFNIGFWMTYQSAQISVAVPANTNTPFDVFCYLSTAGVVTLEAVAWTNGTTRATALTRQDSILVKSGATDRRYIGTLCTTGVSGQTEDSEANRFCWNYYHRARKTMTRTETDTSWTYASGTIRQANGNAANQVNFVIGVSEDAVEMTLTAACAGNAVTGVASIALDSTSSQATNTARGFGTALSGNRISFASLYCDYPAEGSHYLAWVEEADGGTVTFYGAITVGNVTARLGMTGTIWC